VLNNVDLDDELPDLPTFPHGSSSEDDLPELSDLPDLARTASKTPLRSSTCPPTPRSNSAKMFGSKSGSQFPAVVILDSEEDEDNEDLMDGIEHHEIHYGIQPFERQVRAQSSVSAHNPNIPTRPDTRAQTRFDPSIRSRRNWPSWAEEWNAARLRQRGGRPRYHEVHPNNNWLLRDVDEGGEVDIRDERDENSILQSIEHDYDPDEYDVERIMGERRRRGKHEFLVRWVGWDEMNWISVRNCFCPDLIEEFRSAQRARRANLLATPVDGQEFEAESLRQLADAARISAETGNVPNPSRLRLRDKKGRYSRKAARHHAVTTEPVPMEIDDPQPHSESDDEDFGTPRLRVQRSNTAIRSRNRPQSVFWNTPQEPQDGEILWVRSRTITPDSPDTLAGDEGQMDMEVINENDEVETDDDVGARRSSLAAMDHTEMERRQAQEVEEKRRQLEMDLQLQAQRVSAEREQERERQKQEKLAETVRRARYEAQRERKQELLMETVLKGSQQLRLEQQDAEGQERIQALEKQRQDEEERRQAARIQAIEQHRQEMQREARRAERETGEQVQALERQRQEEEQQRAEQEEAKKQRQLRDLERKQKKLVKKQRRESRSKSKPPVKQESGSDHKKPPLNHKLAIQTKLADASAAAQEKVPRKPSFSSSSKKWHHRSTSSMRRSEDGDTLRMKLEQERQAAGPKVIRPEFVRSMNAKQHEALISRARQDHGPKTMGSSRSSHVIPSVEK